MGIGLRGSLLIVIGSFGATIAVDAIRGTTALASTARELRGGQEEGPWSCNSRPCPPACLTQLCLAQEPEMICTEWRYNASFQCVLDPEGPLSSCKTKPKNEGCRRKYQNPCDVENTVCTVLVAECGSAYYCE